MFYIMNKENLVLFDDDIAKLQATRQFMPQLTEETRETDIVTADELRQYPNKVIAVPNEYEVEVQDYEIIIEEEQIPIYDENGEITGYETIEVEKRVPAGTHLETRVYYTLDLNPNFEDEEKAKEKARIAEISLTRADVFEALILARGLTKQMLRSFIELDETLNDIEKALYLNRFDDALEFYRKHPAIDFISAKLGISADDMDKFFDTKDYTYLVTTEQVTNQVTNQVEEITDETDVNNSEPLDEENSVVEDVTAVEDVNNLEEESK